MPRPATRDPLPALLQQHTTSVKRRLGSNAYGDTYADAVDEMGLVDDSNDLVMGANGEEALSSARVFYPAGIAEIPLGSQVTLEAPFLTHVRRVIGVSVKDAGGLPMPDYVQVALQ